MTVARALITLFKTLPPEEQKEVSMWIKKHESSNQSQEIDERKDFLEFSASGLNRAYNDNEPEYSLDDCIEENI